MDLQDWMGQKDLLVKEAARVSLDQEGQKVLQGELEYLAKVVPTELKGMRVWMVHQEQEAQLASPEPL